MAFTLPLTMQIECQGRFAAGFMKSLMDQYYFDLEQ
jgi:hypothetical protein